MAEQRLDVRLVGKLGEQAERPEADLLVVVLERLEGEIRRPRRGRRLHDGEGLLADGRRLGRGEDARHPGQDALVRVLLQMVESGVDDRGIGMREEPLQLLEEGPAGQKLERAHGLAADGFGPRAQVREDRCRGRLVGKPLQEREARLAQGRVRLDRHPGDVPGLEVAARRSGS